MKPFVFREGLRLAPPNLKFPRLAGPARKLPTRHDVRDGMLPSDNQGQTSRCASHAMCAALEYARWLYLDIVEQLDAAKMHRIATVEVDGGTEDDGTFLESVVEAAYRMGLIHRVPPGEIHIAENLPDFLYLIRRYQVALGGLMITDGWSKSGPNGWINHTEFGLGGHAIAACTYDLRLDNADPDFVGFQNSWGEGQGWRGFNRMRIPDFRDEFQYGLAFDYGKYLAT